MIGNLKALLVAMLALGVLGVGAASASAAEFTAPGAGAGEATEIVSEKDEFGGVAKTAHQVLDIRKKDGTGLISLTCNEAAWTNASFTGASATEITTTLDFRESPASSTCTFNSQSVSLNNGNCDFRFTAASAVHISDDGLQSSGDHCMHGEKPITFEDKASQCKVEIGTQTIAGVKYHNIQVGGAGTRMTITLEATNLAFEYNATGAGCAYGTTTNGLLTTGNTILSGKRGGNPVEIKWDA